MMKKIILSEGGNVSFYNAISSVNKPSLDKKGKPYLSAHSLQLTADNISSPGGAQDSIHQFLTGLHQEFKGEHGEDLFGENASGLGSPGKKNKDTVYSGSSASMMGASGVSSDQFIRSKSDGINPAQVGDIDLAIRPEHGDMFRQTAERLKNQGKKIGPYTILGHEAKGNEIHVLAQHDNGRMHQFDFNKTVGLGQEPTEDSMFPTSHSEEDLKNGFKGVVHKLLLNGAGGDRYKFSMYGLGDRSTPEPPKKATAEEKIAHAQANYQRNPETVARTLFPGIEDKDTKHIKHSAGVAYLMGKHSTMDFDKVFDGDSEGGGIAAGLRARGFDEHKIADHRAKLSQAFQQGRENKNLKLESYERKPMKQYLEERLANKISKPYPSPASDPHGLVSNDGDMRERLVRWHRLHVIGESNQEVGVDLKTPTKIRTKGTTRTTHSVAPIDPYTGAFEGMKNRTVAKTVSVESMNDERRDNLIENLLMQEALHNVISDKITKLSMHLMMHPGEIAARLKSSLARAARKHKEKTIEEKLQECEEYFSSFLNESQEQHLVEFVEHIQKTMDIIKNRKDIHPKVKEASVHELHRATVLHKLATHMASKGDHQESNKALGQAAEIHNRVASDLGIKHKPVGQENAESGKEKDKTNVPHVRNIA